ncbi:polyphosphate polymerase domain-containing protein [Sporocytophaga myxococcoides]|uniref:polyphosphate polymerase domain-containing protein n=1 Tax=Sporocytophaga myxococcoides TaxID=153721 RepID=UPI0004902041|nr:polyphosphate polymerase domain-containing protein [Sporocytophaga myxococcoides]
MMLRYERKYFVPNDRLDELRARLMPFVNPDVHTKVGESGLSQYTVRSIYYDTPFMEYYYEKKEGLEFRNKFRIRGYDNQKEDSIVFLEIKRKLSNRIGKHRATLKFSDLKSLLTTGNTRDYINGPKLPKALKDADKFLFYYYSKSLKPVNLVVYDREAFHGKFDDEVRITFDKNVRTSIYPTIDELYSEERLKLITPGFFVLEIKYYNIMPTWARSIVEEFSLQLEAISKYSSGLDIHHTTYGRMRFSPISLSRNPFYRL